MDFIRANGENWFRWFIWARWAVLPLSLLGVLVSYRWAREPYGAPSGLLALWCTGPPTFTSPLADIRAPTDDGWRWHNR